MKVKLTAALQRDGMRYRPGQIIECSERDHIALIRHGIAEKAPDGAKANAKLVSKPANRKPERATLDRGEKAVTAVEPARCKGTTGLGNPCKRAPMADSDFCANHQPGG